MSTASPTTGRTTTRDDTYDSRPPARRTTETKGAIKTTEFIVFIASVVGVLLASSILGSSRDSSDFFSGDKAWLYVTLLSIGYMVSRGLAKSGSCEHYDS